MKQYLSQIIGKTPNQSGTATVKSIGKTFDFQAKTGKTFRMVPLVLEFQGNDYEEKVFENSLKFELKGITVGSKVDVRLNGKFCAFSLSQD